MFYKKNIFPITIKKHPMLQVTKGEDASELYLKKFYFSFYLGWAGIQGVVCNENERCVCVYTCIAQCIKVGVCL